MEDLSCGIQNRPEIRDLTELQYWVSFSSLWGFDGSRHSTIGYYRTFMISVTLQTSKLG